MLAGVLPERLWPSTGLTPTSWRNQPTEVFEIASLWASRPGVWFGGLLGPLPPEDDFPHIVIWNGQRVIEDGHHRVVRMLLEGKTHVLARWVEVG